VTHDNGEQTKWILFCDPFHNRRWMPVRRKYVHSDYRAHWVVLLYIARVQYPSPCNLDICIELSVINPNKMHYWEWRLPSWIKLFRDVSNKLIYCLLYQVNNQSLVCGISYLNANAASFKAISWSPNSSLVLLLNQCEHTSRLYLVNYLSDQDWLHCCADNNHRIQTLSLRFVYCEGKC
jgi:hypothetical protein